VANPSEPGLMTIDSRRLIVLLVNPNPYGHYRGNVGLAVRAAIVCSLGQYFGQLELVGLSSSSCAHNCLLSQFEQQR
jgi:hypothetical protein